MKTVDYLSGMTEVVVFLSWVLWPSLHLRIFLGREAFEYYTTCEDFDIQVHAKKLRDQTSSGNILARNSSSFKLRRFLILHKLQKLLPL